jgi:TrwC relaxase
VHSGEAPGRWTGTAAQQLELSGTVAAEDLQAVLDGRNPSTGRTLITARRPDRLPGLDLTFSAPKSVSLLFALSDERMSLAIRHRGHAGSNGADLDRGVLQQLPRTEWHPGSGPHQLQLVPRHVRQPANIFRRHERRTQ